MSKYLPSFKALRAFEATVRLESLSAAAEELNVTPGAISRQITSLEEWVGHPLMRRSRQGVLVNARGKALSKELGEGFLSIHKALRKASNPGTQRPIVLSVYPTFAIQWLMPRLADFYAAEPQLDLRIQTSLKPPNFDRDDIDVAVMIAEASSSGNFSIPLFDRVFTPVCSPSLISRFEGQPPEAALKAEQLLLSDLQMDHWTKWLDMAGLSNVLLERSIRFENSSLAWQAAREGVGFAMGQEILLKQDLDDGRLVMPFETRFKDARQYRLSCRMREAEVPAINAVFKWFALAADA